MSGGGGRTREGPKRGGDHCWGGILHWGGGGVYYITKGGGCGGIMVWVMAVRKCVMSDVKCMMSDV